jgi:hypothetical protein
VTLACVELRTQVVNVFGADAETLDHARVQASLVVACKVVDVALYLGLQTLHEAVGGAVVESLRREVAAIPLSHALANLTVLEAAVRSRVAEWAAPVGLETSLLRLLSFEGGMATEEAA